MHPDGSFAVMSGHRRHSDESVHRVQMALSEVLCFLTSPAQQLASRALTALAPRKLRLLAPVQDADPLVEGPREFHLYARSAIFLIVATSAEAAASQPHQLLSLMPYLPLHCRRHSRLVAPSAALEPTVAGLPRKVTQPSKSPVDPLLPVLEAEIDLGAVFGPGTQPESL